MLQLILVYSPRPVCLLPFLGANIFSYGFSSRTAECSLVFFPMDGNLQVGDSAATLLLDADDDFISLVFFPMGGNLQVENSAETLLLDADENFRFLSVLTSPPFLCPKLMGESSETGAARGVDDSGTSILTAFSRQSSACCPLLRMID